MDGVVFLRCQLLGAAFSKNTDSAREKAPLHTFLERWSLESGPCHALFFSRPACVRFSEQLAGDGSLPVFGAERGKALYF